MATREVYKLDGQTFVYITTQDQTKMVTNKLSEYDSYLALGLIIAAVTMAILLTIFGNFAAGFLALCAGGVAYVYNDWDKQRRSFYESVNVPLPDKKHWYTPIVGGIIYYGLTLSVPAFIVAGMMPNFVGGMGIGILYLLTTWATQAFIILISKPSKKIQGLIWKKFGALPGYESEEQFELRMTKMGAAKEVVDESTLDLTVEF
jgi:hypothetical protein